MAKEDAFLSSSLHWALDHMSQAGFPITEPVALQMDPALRIMGYAKHDPGKHVIVVAEWALDSGMLGGLLLHELAHIYHTEKRTPSHQSALVQEEIESIVTREGLTQTEASYLADAFSHLQNILVDDIVFNILQSDRDLKQVQKFFFEWVSERPTGDPRLDAALLTRNAFAVASLGRRNLYDQQGEMAAKNKRFLTLYGDNAEEAFHAVERRLEEARTDLDATEFRRTLREYLDTMVSLMRRSQGALEELR